MPYVCVEIAAISRQAALCCGVAENTSSVTSEVEAVCSAETARPKVARALVVNLRLAGKENIVPSLRVVEVVARIQAWRAGNQKYTTVLSGKYNFAFRVETVMFPDATFNWFHTSPSEVLNCVVSPGALVVAGVRITGATVLVVVVVVVGTLFLLV